MKPKAPVSVIINNYNYDRFLRKAINSVLEQSLPAAEVIVVDDGSTDMSIDIIREYGDKIIPVFKSNGGQASAFNAGIAASTADWIWFLDADDWLKKDALETIKDLLDTKFVKIHAPLISADETGNFSEVRIPDKPLSQGNVLEEMIREGGYTWPPTSGNIFAAWALRQCIPVPEVEYRLCADLYICNTVAMLGEIVAVNVPLGFYRIHGNNGFRGFKLEDKWLKNQARNIIQSASLTQELVRKYSDQKGFNYRFGRRNVEMLMIVKRLAGEIQEGSFTKMELRSFWMRSAEVLSLRGKSRIAGNVFWWIISYAPLPVVRFFIERGIRKGEKRQINI